MNQRNIDEKVTSVRCHHSLAPPCCDVLLVSNLYPPVHIGGYEIAARDVAEGLRQYGVSVSVLATDYRIHELKTSDPSIYRELKLANSWFGDYPVQSAQANMKFNYDKTLYVIQRTKPKLLYAWNQANLGGGVLEAAYRSGVPILHHIMGYDLLDYVHKQQSFLNRISAYLRGFLNSRTNIYPLNDYHIKNIVFLSRFMQDYYRKCGVLPAFSTVVHPGIDVADVQVKSDYKSSGNVVRVVYVGQLVEHKGVMEIKLALNEVKRRKPDCDIHLTLCGDGERHFVHELLKESNIRIHYKGFMDRALLYDHLFDYDIGIFSSTWQEPFGIAQIEIMAAGLPLLSSATGGAIEPLTNGYNAIVFHPQDQQDLVNKIITLIDQYDLQAFSLGRNARQTVEDFFSADAMHEKIHKIAHHIIQNPQVYL